MIESKLRAAAHLESRRFEASETDSSSVKRSKKGALAPIKGMYVPPLNFCTAYGHSRRAFRNLL